MIQNPSVVGSGGNGDVGVEIVPVRFDSSSGGMSPVQIIYTTVENGNVVYKDKVDEGIIETIYALKGSVLYCTVNSSDGNMLSLRSGGIQVASGTHQGLYAQDYDFRVYQVTG